MSGMSNSTVAPYGSWKSPIAADRVAAKSIQLAEVAADGADVYWIELRPAEGGRQVIVQRKPDGTTFDRTPKGFNARTRVHEYGGGAYVVADGVLWFSNFDDQRLYRQAGDAAPVAITPTAAYRFADAVFDPARNHLIAVREDHTGAGEAINTLVAIRAGGDLNGGTLLVSGNDFYAAPRLSPDGEYLAWLTWNHPNLPWDGCELWVAHVDEAGTLDEPVKVAGGPTESICQPEWSPDGVLHFVSDRTDWWNLYRWRAGQVEALCPMAAEFGQPAWQFRISNYGFAEGGRIVCAYTQDGLGQIGLLEPGAGALRRVEGPFSIFGSLRVAGARALMLAGSATAPTAVTALDLKTLAWTSISDAATSEVDAAYFSVPRAIAFPTTSGAISHALYYPPASRDYSAPEGNRPPLIVRSHGGPTSAANAAFSMGIQYFTSRGFAFVDVNYGGSSGYGRAYRERLKGQWGVVDVDDCINAAKYLVSQGLADENKVAIEGGSAGGYTTLAALAFRDYFKAGASLFGLSELEIFAKETHKYESRYLDGLIGPYPAERDLYIERSPLFKARNISVPVIFFQGDEDKIVPPNQAELMFEAVRAREIPTAYVLYPGEQHGFRKAENIQRTLEGRLYFYAQVFGIALADDIPALEIENL